jgi:hypothetical protein
MLILGYFGGRAHLSLAIHWMLDVRCWMLDVSKVHGEGEIAGSAQIRHRRAGRLPPSSGLPATAWLRRYTGDIPVCLPWGALPMGDAPISRRSTTGISPGRQRDCRAGALDGYQGGCGDGSGPGPVGVRCCPILAHRGSMPRGNKRRRSRTRPRRLCKEDADPTAA